MLGEFGMGLEWFQVWECRRCPATHDRLRDGQCAKTHRNQESAVRLYWRGLWRDILGVRS